MTEPFRRREDDALRSFQEALLPRKLDHCAYVDVAAAFRPAAGEVVGGDFHEVIQSQGREVLVIGDVTGHGVPAALVMAMLFGAIHEAFRFERHACQVLDDLHELLADLGARSGGPLLFSATVFIAVIGPDGTLAHAGAGHSAPLLYRAGKAPVALASKTPPLGFVEPKACTEDVVQLAPGDRLLLYTDGVLTEGGLDALASRLARLEHQSPDAIVRGIVSEGAEDDRTAVFVTYTGKDCS